MTTRAIGLVGRVPRGGASAYDKQVSIVYGGNTPTARLILENLTGPIVNDLSPELADLLEIATAAYLLDCAVRRGGERDAMGTHWRRDLTLRAGVRAVDKWTDGETQRQLRRVLEFLTEDRWQFEFHPHAGTEQQIVIPFPGFTPYPQADCVSLFSGGADSMSGAVALVTGGRHPILASHRASPIVSSRQRGVRDELQSAISAWSFPHVSLWAGMLQGGASEYSQRSRSFLYLSLAVTLARQLGISEVFVPENGIVSVNLPRLEQTIGARASRSTHPKYLKLASEFFEFLTGPGLIISNPFWAQTRAEVFGTLSTVGVGQLLKYSVSCAHTMRREAGIPHCGTCSQCLDRRFAAIASDLEQHDAEYGINVFTDVLKGEGLQHAESLVRFARTIRTIPSGEELLKRFPQLMDALLSLPGSPAGIAEQLFAMHGRFARETLAVLESMTTRHASDIAAGSLPKSCLLNLI